MFTLPDKSMTWPLWVYVAIWIFFVYLFTQIIGFDVRSIPNILISGMYFVEFGVHEASHIVFAFLPAVFDAAAGSFGEVSFTLLLLFAIVKAKAYFASIFAALWVMLAMNSVGKITWRTPGPKVYRSLVQARRSRTIGTLCLVSWAGWAVI